MMFLTKVAFWLTILILLIPTDGQQQIQVYGTAEAAVKDVAGFCERNPETCIAGKNAFAVLMQKAEYGAGLLMDFAQGKTASGESTLATAGDGVMPLQPALWDMGESQDTLSSEDREAAWGG
ncbi:MAG: DUF5330 domain-containing protein [Methyloceanibacter sp.]